MKLSLFINQNIEEILAEWESFARTNVPAASDMSDLALRDHARQILSAIAHDIDTRQNLRQQYEKSRGLAMDAYSEKSAASIHGALRHASNFSLLQLSAEFRALRATVLRLWLPKIERCSEDTTYEMVRFNEAIDQALAESVVTYAARADHARDMFLAILGHDLRSPLSTMALAGEMLAHPEVSQGKISSIGERVRRSARLMNCMVEDLLGYTRTQLGGGLPVTPREIDITAICQSAIEDAGATHPASKFELHTHGDLTGLYDEVRLHQLFTNLLVNAAQYGEKKSAVIMNAQGDANAVTVSVTNHGPAIPQTSLESMFQPLIQLPIDDEKEARPKTSLGLGLFVAREIAMAHGGAIEVKSRDVEGTTFSVCLPRNAAR